MTTHAERVEGLIAEWGWSGSFTGMGKFIEELRAIAAGFDQMEKMHVDWMAEHQKEVDDAHRALSSVTRERDEATQETVRAQERAGRAIDAANQAESRLAAIMKHLHDNAEGDLVDGHWRWNAEGKVLADIERLGPLPDVVRRLEVQRIALERIERWFGEFPASGRYWREVNGVKEPMSYGVAFGSNGERDYMRGIARAALAAAEKEEG